MDVGELYDLIDTHGGDDYVMAFCFDNTSRIIFRNNMCFDRSKHINGNFIEIEDIDTHKNVYVTAKHIDHIQTVLFSDKPKDHDKYEKRYIIA